MTFDQLVKKFIAQGFDRERAAIYARRVLNNEPVWS